MKGKYFNSPVITPTVVASTMNAAYAEGDIVFDWTSFDIPRGSSRLLGATITYRHNNVVTQVAGVDLIFAKDDGTNSTPTTIGTGNAILGTTNFSRTDIIGVLPGTVADFAGMTATAASYQTIHSSPSPVILEPNPDSGTNVGFDRYYIAGVTGGSVDLRGACTVDGTPGTGQANLDVADLDPRTVFAVGDVIHDEDNRLMGTIESLAAADIVMTGNLANAGVNDKKLYNINPIRVLLHFTK